jgi:hypothetical protein
MRCITNLTGEDLSYDAVKAWNLTRMGTPLPRHKWKYRGSTSCHFAPEKMASSTHWMGGCMGPGDGLVLKRLPWPWYSAPWSWRQCSYETSLRYDIYPTEYGTLRRKSLVFSEMALCEIQNTFIPEDLSHLKTSRTLKLTAERSSETSVNIHQTARRHMSEYSNLNQRRNKKR